MDRLQDYFENQYVEDNDLRVKVANVIESSLETILSCWNEKLGWNYNLADISKTSYSTTLMVWFAFNLLQGKCSSIIDSRSYGKNYFKNKPIEDIKSIDENILDLFYNRITEELNEAVEEAYKSEETKVIDDIEQDTISDEPIIKEESIKEPIKEKPTVSAFYQKHLDIQNEYPDAVVIQRLGDFYEVMGEKAMLISEQLDLTLTGRDVGLPERVPMVGFPFHVLEKYIKNILACSTCLTVWLSFPTIR